MKERPILFQAPMVRALLAGTKTQTRREINWRRLHKVAGLPFPTKCKLAWFNLINGWGLDAGDGMMRAVSCPYGAVGDRLWVKETFRVNGTMAGPRITYAGDEAQAFPSGCPDECSDWIADDNHWRPSIFMRRYASRILLEITAVRVERLNAITGADAIAEGIEERFDGQYLDYDWKLKGGSIHTYGDPRESYRSLWQSINGRGSWALNPWVWVIEFRRITPAA